MMMQINSFMNTSHYARLRLSIDEPPNEKLLMKYWRAQYGLGVRLLTALQSAKHGIRCLPDHYNDKVCSVLIDVTYI